MTFSIATLLTITFLTACNCDELLSRHRRFLLPQASGWKFTTTLTLKLPIDALGTSISFSVPFKYDIDSGSITGRGFDFGGDLDQQVELSPSAEHELRRFRLLESVEQRIASSPALSKAFFNASSSASVHDCVLRTLCEMAETPEHGNGVIGDAFALLTIPTHVIDELNGANRTTDFCGPIGEIRSKGPDFDEYIEAQIDGRVQQNCQRYHEHCDTSMFKVMHAIVHVLIGIFATCDFSCCRFSMATTSTHSKAPSEFRHKEKKMTTPSINCLNGRPMKSTISPTKHSEKTLLFIFCLKM